MVYTTKKQRKCIRINFPNTSFPKLALLEKACLPVKKKNLCEYLITPLIKKAQWTLPKSEYNISNEIVL